MKLESKYDIGQKVFHISQCKRKEWVSCDSCAGTGIITLVNNVKRKCPDCYGRCGEYKYFDMQWEVVSQLTLAQITICARNIIKTGIFDNIGKLSDESNTTFEIEYMAYESGVGSGSVYQEDNLFSKKEEAQVECDKRNTI